MKKFNPITRQMEDVKTFASERGEQGAQGIQGIQGVKGDRGDMGIQGMRGEKGEKGDKGDRGERGEKGATGERGLQGNQGIKGDKGERGERGERGLTGQIGLKGENGKDGTPIHYTSRVPTQQLGEDGEWCFNALREVFHKEQGKWRFYSVMGAGGSNIGGGGAGSVGPTGAAGAQGQTGAAGANGATGATGSSAYEVAVANGFVGDVTAWLNSLIGQTGATGATGAAGATGQTGAAGASGSGNFGTSTLDFGNTAGSSFVYLDVTGIATMTTTAYIQCWVQGNDTTADHNAENHLILATTLKCVASDIVSGTGFRINAFSDNRISGTLKVRWSWAT